MALLPSDGGQPVHVPGPTVTTLPDYNAILAQYMDPYKQMLAAQMAQLANRNSQSSNFANSNYGYQSDQLKQQHELAMIGISNMLAAHGMTDSGDTHFRNKQENRSYNNQLGLLKNSLAQYMANLQNSYTDAQLQGQQSLSQQQLSLIPFIQQMYQPTTTSGMTPKIPAPGAVTI